MSTFVPSKEEILVKNISTSLHEVKTGSRQWTLIIIFCVDVYNYTWGLTPSPVHMRPPEPDPLHVDVINGWLLIGNLQPGMRSMTKIKVIRNFGRRRGKVFPRLFVTCFPEKGGIRRFRGDGRPCISMI